LTKGDRVPAKYFVIRIVSSDPAKWGQNKLIQTLEIKSSISEEIGGPGKNRQGTVRAGGRNRTTGLAP
jgi:hypothetical protein